MSGIGTKELQVDRDEMGRSAMIGNSGWGKETKLPFLGDDEVVIEMMNKLTEMNSGSAEVQRRR